MRALLWEREFRLLFCGQATSVIGDRIVFVALALYVTQIGSPSDVGLVLAAHALPLVGFVLLGGVWADRLPRHRVMLATDLSRFALNGLLAALIFTGTVRVWQIAVLEALTGVAEAFFQPAYTGVIPQTVPEAMIQPAKALTSSMQTIAGFAGPAIATALVFGAGAGWAFAVDAATFLVSAAFLVPLRPRTRGEAPVAQPLLMELREGWQAVRERTWVWVTIASFSFAIVLALAPWFTLGATVARQAYGREAVYGVMVTAEGAGTLLGAAVALRWRPQHPLRVGFVLCLPWSVPVAAFALGAPAWLLVVPMAISGTGVALFIIWWETALAERVPPHLLSRVTSYDWMGSLALLPLGYLVAGPLGEALGAREVLFGGAVLSILMLVAGFAVPDVRQLRRLEPAA